MRNYMALIKIKHIDYGIACRIKDTIYINKNLYKNTALYKSILSHELEHSSGFEKKDFIIDLKNNHLKGMKLDYYKFVILNPKSWVEFFPFWKYDNKLAFNITVSLIYGMSLIILGGIGLLVTTK